MKVINHEKIESNVVEMDGASDCQVRFLVGKDDSAPNFAMRQFEIAPGGHTPRHKHPYEHEVFILEGSGIIFEGDQQHPLNSGDVVYVAPDEVHQFRNTGQVPLKFLCLVPNSSVDKAVTVVPECGVEKDC